MKLTFIDTIQKVFDSALVIEQDLTDLNIIIFSDHHRGTKDKADDYRYASKTYQAALDHYYEKKSLLVLLGDVEELWENPAKKILEQYQDIHEKELLFDKESRYLRLWGNHDADWSNKTQASKYLKILRPVLEGINIKIRLNEECLGYIFLIHGHQGSTFSDQYARLSKFFVRYFWKYFQKIFNQPLNTAATSTKMRSKHDRKFYSWAHDHHHDVIVITGHTHEPVFNAFTYADQLRINYSELIAKKEEGVLTEIEAQKLAETETRLKNLKKHDSTHLNAQGSASPCYFNSGCCSFADGEITAIELMDGEVRLIKWTLDVDGKSQRKIIQKERLDRIFSLLKLDAKIAATESTSTDGQS